jgi:CMP-N-acetylneuraminic acid synthetase
MQNNKKILLTVAARGGSRGVKDKNIRDLCGKPLIAYTIMQAKKWGGAECLICSTDSEQIARIAAQYGAEVPFMRPKELAGDTTGKIDVLRHALKTYEGISGKRFEILVDLDVTAPIREIRDIQGSVDIFLSKRPKSVFSVTKSRRNPYFNMVEIGENGYAKIVKNPDRPLLRRQDAPAVYDVNASIYVYDREYILDDITGSALSDRTLVYVMDEISAFDIDSERDFQFIEYLVTKGVVKL